MITLYSGTPGSGKSLNTARLIYERLTYNKKYPNVIANFKINEKQIKNKNARFLYYDNSDITVELLAKYCKKYHKIGIENQTLLVVDECSVKWNARDWSDKSRPLWIKFFQQHRKLGFNIYLITQDDLNLDKQLRNLIEFDIIHRKVNNDKLGKYFPISTFVAIKYWYGNNVKLGQEFFIYRKKWGTFYDSYGTFSIDETISDLLS